MKLFRECAFALWLLAVVAILVTACGGHGQGTDGDSSLPAIPINSYCPKSVSNGTRTALSAGGTQSGDLQCATSLTPEQAALVRDCLALTS